jgi:hypothetical protein
VYENVNSEEAPPVILTSSVGTSIVLHSGLKSATTHPVYDNAATVVVSENVYFMIEQLGSSDVNFVSSIIKLDKTPELVNGIEKSVI